MQCFFSVCVTVTVTVTVRLVSMMLTPRFSLDQDERFVLVTIHAPFTNVAETEVFMEGTDFR